jgi:4a-hydroxytetrahydrobiopterin dehydratase
MQPYSPEELDALLTELPDWISTDFAIHRSYEFLSFRAAMTFVNQVADIAEQNNHHPDIEIRFREVALSLWTHTVGGVTKRDLDLARAISELG